MKASVQRKWRNSTLQINNTLRSSDFFRFFLFLKIKIFYVVLKLNLILCRLMYHIKIGGTVHCN